MNCISDFYVCDLMMCFFSFSDTTFMVHGCSAEFSPLTDWVVGDGGAGGREDTKDDSAELLV